MARNVFGGSLQNAMDKANSGKNKTSGDIGNIPARSSPTISRAQASVLEEDKHSTRLLDTSLIQMSAVNDRIDPASNLDSLIESIREHGQKVPILVRKLAAGQYEVVYGRRRLLASRALGVKVRATVTEMSDEEAIIAQGIENNARQDPSFIERALFVSDIIREFGKTEDTRRGAQTIAHKALQVDESLISRMNRIALGLPIDLIRIIGPAHGAGRRMWEKLTKLYEARPDLPYDSLHNLPDDLSGPDRLQKAIDLLSPQDPPPTENNIQQDPIRISKKGNRITLDFDPEQITDFEQAIYAFVQNLLDRGQETEPKNQKPERRNG